MVLTYFISEKQFDSTEVITSPSPLESASADAFALAATLASFAFAAAMAAWLVAATVSICNK